MEPTTDLQSNPACFGSTKEGGGGGDRDDEIEGSFFSRVVKLALGVFGFQTNSLRGGGEGSLSIRNATELSTLILGPRADRLHRSTILSLQEYILSI